MIDADIDLRELERSLTRMSAIFGEANQTGIARWGNATCKSLVKQTQAWGDNTKAKESQQKAIKWDAYNLFIVVKDPKLVRLLMQKKLTGLRVKGVIHTFRPHQQIIDVKNINDAIEFNRTSRRKRVPARQPGSMLVTSEALMNKALRLRYVRAGKAKGAWIGAGNEISKFQKSGKKLTIGKNFASYAQKFASGGSASLIKNTWEPTGIVNNSVPYAADGYVLKKSAMQKALKDGAENTIKWYEKTMQGRLNRRTR
jgi:hypothetical protein